MRAPQQREAGHGRRKEKAEGSQRGVHGRTLAERRCCSRMRHVAAYHRAGGQTQLAGGGSCRRRGGVLGRSGRSFRRRTSAAVRDPAQDDWPPEFNDVSVETQAMYRYAVANREVLQYIPCSCGCVNGGHGSNFDCYVREVLPDGRVRLDTMSFG